MSASEPLLLRAMPFLVLLFAMGLAIVVLSNAPRLPTNKERCAAIGMDYSGDRPWFRACIDDKGQYFKVPETMPKDSPND